MSSTPPNTPKDDPTGCIEETASLWKKRRIAVDAPYFTLRDLAHLDESLHTQINTLNQSSAQSWRILEQRLSSPQRQLDDLFPAAVLAFAETAPTHRCDFLLAFISANEQHVAVFIEALSWLPLENLKKYLLQFLESPNPLYQRIAITTCASQRSDVGHYLDAALASDNPSLRLCALKAAGELGRLDLLPELQQRLNADDPEQGFWAAWSATRLGDRQAALEVLKIAASAAFPWRNQALRLASRLFDPHALFPWLHVNAPKESLDLTKIAISAAGAAGYARFVPWLIEQMQDPELARSAGEAFTLITGIDIVNHKLGVPASNKSPDDPERGLPWPDMDAINAWWQTHHAKYPAETRCLLGHPITPDHCLHVLVNGYQRQRAAAALELALIQTGMPLFAVHAPAAEQQDLLNVRDTLQTCFETAAQLWLERDQAAGAPMTTLEELAELDGQLEQQLTLLREAGDLGWKCCTEYLSKSQPGYVFVAATTAVSHPDSALFQQIIHYIEAAPGTVHELIAGLGWVAPTYLRGQVQSLLTSNSPLLRYAGIAACGLHQVDPGRHLDAALKDSGLRLRRRALRTVGELRIRRHLSTLQAHLAHANEQWRFWAAWSASFLLENSGLQELRKMTEQHNLEASLQLYAIDLLARAMEPGAARLWIRQLLLDEQMAPMVIRGLGMLGDPSVIPWLIRRMAGSSDQARLAGEAFSRITGVDLVEQGLVLASSASLESQDQEYTVLPCPDPQAVQQWWSKKRRNYKKNRCYLMGFPISVEVCWQVLLHGHQFQRAAAALELALLEPQTALFPIEAPGFRQWEWLSAIRTQRTVAANSDDDRSTIPQSFSSETELTAEVNRLRLKLGHTQDESLVDAMHGLAEFTRPVTRGWLFRRKALLESQQKKPALEHDSLLMEDQSRMLMEGGGQQILLPDPTPITIRTARGILKTNKVQHGKRVVNKKRVAINNDDIIPPVENFESGETDIILEEVVQAPVSHQYIRSSILLSSVTFEWYFHRISDIWQKNYVVATGRYTSFSQFLEADNYLRPYIDYLPEIPDKLWNKIENISEDRWKAGHLFAASLIALKHNHMKRMRKVINIAIDVSNISQGFISAFGWLSPSLVKDRINMLLCSKYVRWRRLGMMVVLMNHIECKDFLLKLIEDSDEQVKSLAIKAIGKLAYTELMPFLKKLLNSNDEDCRFWSAWSSILLGDRQAALERLKSFVVSPAPLRQHQALPLILRVSDTDDIRRWILKVNQHNHRLYAMMIDTGACKNILWIPWLLEEIRQPERAHVASEAFSNLTGVDLINEGFMRPRVIHPSDSSLQDSMELARFFIPDNQVIDAWWDFNKNRYEENKSYLFGREITLQNCLWILKNGRQYQRSAAALEMSLLKDHIPLLEIHASSLQQYRWINQVQAKETE